MTIKRAPRAPFTEQACPRPSSFLPLPVALSFVGRAPALSFLLSLSRALSHFAHLSSARSPPSSEDGVGNTTPWRHIERSRIERAQKWP